VPINDSNLLTSKEVIRVPDTYIQGIINMKSFYSSNSPMKYKADNNYHYSIKTKNQVEQFLKYVNSKDKLELEVSSSDSRLIPSNHMLLQQKILDY
jgi:hypothetical protein